MSSATARVGSRVGTILLVVSTLSASACSARSCARIGVISREAEVAALAKDRGFSLVVTECQDAMRGGYMMEGVFSCLATLDPAQKRALVDGFHLARPVPGPTTGPPVPAYTPTDNFTCIARFSMSRSVNGVAVETLVAGAGSVPGMESVELHVDTNGAACIEFHRVR